MVMNTVYKKLTYFAKNQSGSIVVLFAILLVPILCAVGASVDYIRAYNARSEMQADLDSALIAAVKKVTSSSTSAIETVMENWFAAQTSLASYDFSNVSISTLSGTISATVSASVQTTFMEMFGISEIDIKASSSVVGPSASYLNVYIVLDNSASMMLAATAAGQKTMYTYTSCVFACHTSSGTITYNGTKYTTPYAFAKAAGVTLRTDLELTAAKAVITAVKAADPNASYIKVGVYKIGQTSTLVLSPTSNMTTAAAALTESTAEDYSYFNKSLPALATQIGAAGDGSSSSKPLKLVLLVTDGVQSSLTWIKSTANYPYITPFNPDWCDDIKTNDASLGVLYTTYTTSSYITSDSHYSGTLAKTMASSYWVSYWKGTYHSGVSSSTTRIAYLPTALEDCASSSNLFLSASSSDDITSGLTSLFENYMQTVRLTE